MKPKTIHGPQQPSLLVTAAARVGMDLKEMMSRMDTMHATTEQLVNSITITEGPVTNMSLAVGKASRTPYSDATKVRITTDSRM